MPIDTDLREEIADALAGALGAVAVLREATLLLARRPDALPAERAALALALRHGATSALPLTGPRALLWRAWCGLSDLEPASARWDALRSGLAELATEGYPGARDVLAEALLAEADPVAAKVDAREIALAWSSEVGTL